MKSLSQIDFAIAVGIFLGVFAFSILFTTDRISGIKDQIESLDQYLTGEKILSSLFIDSGNLSLVSKAYRFYVIINNTQPYLKNQSAAVSDLENELVIVNFSSLGYPDIDFNSVRVYNSSGSAIKCEIDPERKILKFLVNISAFESKEFKVWFDDDSNFTLPFCNFSISGSDNLTEIIYPPETFKVIPFSAIEGFSVYDPGHLVAFYTFDEPFGEKFIDRSGNGNTGTFHGEVFNDGVVHGATWVNGKFGKALQFDGVNDYVEISEGNSLNITAQITVEAWVYSNNGWNTIVAKDCPYNTYKGYALGLTSSGRPIFRVGNGSTYYTVIAVNDIRNGWHHVVGTYDGSYLRIYVDGTEKASPVSFSGSIASTSVNVKIGIRPCAGYFNGTIDEIRIYNRALTEEEIKSIYKNNTFIRDGLVAYWRFDEGDGSVAHDSHHIVYSSNKGGSKYGNAISFDGVNDYVDFNSFGPGVTPNEFTLSFWLYSRIPTGTTSHCFVLKPVGGTVLNRWEVSFHNGERIELYLHNGTTSSAVSTTIPNPQNNWHHIVVVFKADEKEEIYIDGTLAKSETPAFSGGIGNSDRYFQIGSRGWYASDNIYFNGTIDDVRIYNRSLNETEIKLLYQRLARYNQLKKQISNKYDFHISIITSNETILDFGPPVPQRAEIYALDRPVFVQLSNGRLEEGTVYIYLWK